jgi:superfamily II DNA/RNA helicase
VKTKHNADRMADKLRKDGHTSQGLHGDLRQNKRDSVMRNFREKNFRILVATDIAARGLDVPHIEHVINYDLPQVAEDFIHRMGRTARAGAEGAAVSFVASQDGRKWNAIERLLNPDAANDYQDEPQRKNKARRKPYRGRPESASKEGGYKGGQKFAKKHFSNSEDRFAAKSADKQRSEKRNETRSDERPARNTDRPKFEKRSDNRSEGRPEKKFEGKKFEGKKFEGARDGKPRAKFEGNRDEKPANPYVGKRENTGNGKPTNKPFNKAKPYGKPAGQGKPEGKFGAGFKKKPGSFKQDGSAPAKRRGPAKPSHKRAA